MEGGTNQLMLQEINELFGDKLAATDGDIGRVQDFYFDDKSWTIRYLVADTGTWLTGRLVLISPRAFGRLDQAGKTLHINLARKQIEGSPSIESHMPVSRQYEAEYHRYYGWPEYWSGGAMSGLAGFPMVLPHSKDIMEAQLQHNRRDDKHLQGIRAVTGFHIQTVDGMIGHVSGFLVDDDNWSISDLVVEAGHWYSGKEIRISAGKVERVSFEESTVFVSLTKADIQRTAQDHHAHADAENHGAGSFRD
jgi:sporulation protein YlmC with PRC-barrel domain